MSKRKPRILLYDIETSPNLAWVWGMWEQNVLGMEQEWDILSVAWKWLGEKKVHVLSKEGKKSDIALVKKIHKLFTEADVVIGHNGDAFDQKKSQARMLFWGMNPPAPFQQVDTLKIARKHFKFNSNKLDNLADILGVGRKLQTGGKELWFACMRNEAKAWKKMRRYNVQDVRLLERVYLKLRPWASSHPNVSAIEGKKSSCPKCGSSKLTLQGRRMSGGGSYQRYQCSSCGSWCRGIKRVRESERSS